MDIIQIFNICDVMLRKHSHICHQYFLYSNNIAHITPSPKTRQKINGAKAHCLALGESHTRPASQCHIEGSAIVHLQRRRNSYDGEMEYFVVVKETARSTEESSYEHQHTKRMKAVDSNTKSD